MEPVIQKSFGSVYQNWKIARLPEYVFFQEGPGLRKWQWTNDGMKVINVKNIRADGGIDLSNSDRYISREEFTQRYSHFAVEEGDIIVASSGNTYGKVARIQAHHLPLMMNTSVIRFHPLSPTSLNQDFLFAFLRSDLFRNQVESFVIGSAQPNFGPSHLKHMEIPFPPLSTQRKIGSILGNYDDLIENNTRRIKILEEMAGTIYREWFVEFRFPGHENVKMVESGLGLIPQGWEINRLGDVTSVITKGTTPTTLGKQFFNDGINFIKVESIDGQGGILENKLAKIDDETHGLLKRSQLFANDILFSIAGAIGRVAIVPDRFLPANTNQALAIIRPSDLSLVSFLYQTLSSSTFLNYSLERVVQTAQANVSLSVLSSAPIIIPPNSVLTDFNRNLAPIISLIERLRAKNSNLRTTRDLLLPKLISGELDVSELDITTDGAQPRKDGTHIPPSLTEWLHSDEKILAGKPVIKGTRLAVEFIIELLENHWSEEDILGNYPNITREDIDACRAYQRKVLDAPVSG